MKPIQSVSFAHLNHPIPSNHSHPGNPPEDRGFIRDRKSRKRSLMSKDPRCEECGMQLRPEAGFPDSAFLIRDSLSCERHVKLVRAAAKLRKIERIQVDITPKGQKWVEARKAQVDRFKEHEQRQKLKKRLMEANPSCSHCGCHLSDGEQGERSACLVIDRLSCLVHVRIVRAYALTESETSIVEESIPTRDEQADIEAQAFWAEIAQEAATR